MATVNPYSTITTSFATTQKPSDDTEYQIISNDYVNEYLNNSYIQINKAANILVTNSHYQTIKDKAYILPNSLIISVPNTNDKVSNVSYASILLSDINGKIVDAYPVNTINTDNGLYVESNVLYGKKVLNINTTSHNTYGSIKLDNVTLFNDNEGYTYVVEASNYNFDKKSTKTIYGVTTGDGVTAYITNTGRLAVNIDNNTLQSSRINDNNYISLGLNTIHVNPEGFKASSDSFGTVKLDGKSLNTDSNDVTSVQPADYDSNADYYGGLKISKYDVNNYGLDAGLRVNNGILSLDTNTLASALGALTADDISISYNTTIYTEGKDITNEAFKNKIISNISLSYDTKTAQYYIPFTLSSESDVSNILEDIIRNKNYNNFPVLTSIFKSGSKYYKYKGLLSMFQEYANKTSSPDDNNFITAIKNGTLEDAKTYEDYEDIVIYSKTIENGVATFEGLTNSIPLTNSEFWSNVDINSHTYYFKTQLEYGINNRITYYLRNMPVVNISKNPTESTFNIFANAESEESNNVILQGSLTNNTVTSTVDNNINLELNNTNAYNVSRIKVSAEPTTVSNLLVNLDVNNNPDKLNTITANNPNLTKSFAKATDVTYGVVKIDKQSIDSEDNKIYVKIKDQYGLNPILVDDGIYISYAKGYSNQENPYGAKKLYYRNSEDTDDVVSNYLNSTTATNENLLEYRHYYATYYYTYTTSDAIQYAKDGELYMPWATPSRYGVVKPDGYSLCSAPIYNSDGTLAYKSLLYDANIKDKKGQILKVRYDSTYLAINKCAYNTTLSSEDNILNGNVNGSSEGLTLSKKVVDTLENADELYDLYNSSPHLLWCGQALYPESNFNTLGHIYYGASENNVMLFPQYSLRNGQNATQNVIISYNSKYNVELLSNQISIGEVFNDVADHDSRNTFPRITSRIAINNKTKYGSTIPNSYTCSLIELRAWRENSSSNASCSKYIFDNIHTFDWNIYGRFAKTNNEDSRFEVVFTTGDEKIKISNSTTLSDSTNKELAEHVEKYRVEPDYKITDDDTFYTFLDISGMSQDADSEYRYLDVMAYLGGKRSHLSKYIPVYNLHNHNNYLRFFTRFRNLINYKNAKVYLRRCGNFASNKNNTGTNNYINTLKWFYNSSLTSNLYENWYSKGNEGTRFADIFKTTGYDEIPPYQTLVLYTFDDKYLGSRIYNGFDNGFSSTDKYPYNFNYLYRTLLKDITNHNPYEGLSFECDSINYNECVLYELYMTAPLSKTSGSSRGVETIVYNQFFIIGKWYGDNVDLVGDRIRKIYPLFESQTYSTGCMSDVWFGLSDSESFPRQDDFKYVRISWTSGITPAVYTTSLKRALNDPILSYFMDVVNIEDLPDGYTYSLQVNYDDVKNTAYANTDLYYTCKNITKEKNDNSSISVLYIYINDIAPESGIAKIKIEIAFKNTDPFGAADKVLSFERDLIIKQNKTSETINTSEIDDIHTTEEI